MEDEIVFRPMSTDEVFCDYVIKKENAQKLKIMGKVVVYSVVLE